LGFRARPRAQHRTAKGRAMTTSAIRTLGGDPVVTTLTAPSVVAPVFPASADVDAIIRLALAEDVGRGDLTTAATVAPDARATAQLLQKTAGVVCGLPVVEAVFARLDPRVAVTLRVEEGSFDARRRV